MTADEALAQQEGSATGYEDKEANEWVDSRLEEGQGRVRASELFEYAKRHGLSERRVRRALKTLGAKRGPDGYQGSWMWTLRMNDSGSGQLED